MGGEAMEEREMVKGGQKRFLLIVFFLCAVLALIIGVYVVLTRSSSRGYEDYTVQKEQYYVEYSDEYDYWDVLTVEYPILSGIDEEQMELLNKRMYDTAMDRVNYWHLEPDEEMRQFQEEYTIFSSDVKCDVTYHSQYLLSVDFEELYAPVNPVYYVYYTERALNMDLMTGEVYELSDVLLIDEDFIDLWCKAANKEYGDNLPYEKETCEFLLRWFSGNDEDMSGYCELRPFFYITKRKEFAVGIAVEPTLAGLSGGTPKSSVYKAILTSADVEPYRTESGFWDKYMESESAGRVLECLDLKENLWLGEDAGVWEYWSDR